VIAAHVIEHLRPPAIKNFLREIARVLHRDGRLFLLTPNLFDLSRILLRKRWMPDPTHITMFHPFSLASLIRTNFKEVRFVFKIPITYINSSNGVGEFSGDFHDRPSTISNLALFAFTTTPLAYLRRVTHMVATVKK
jgi:SAM-dependent methyltransferase